MSPILWYGIKQILLTLLKKKITSFKAKVMKLPTMSMDIFDKTLETIDEHYPFSLSPKLIIGITSSWWYMIYSYWLTIHMV